MFSKSKLLKIRKKNKTSTIFIVSLITKVLLRLLDVINIANLWRIEVIFPTKDRWLDTLVALSTRKWSCCKILFSFGTATHFRERKACDRVKPISDTSYSRRKLSRGEKTREKESSVAPEIGNEAWNADFYHHPSMAERTRRNIQ